MTASPLAERTDGQLNGNSLPSRRRAVNSTSRRNTGPGGQKVPEPAILRIALARRNDGLGSLKSRRFMLHADGVDQGGQSCAWIRCGALTDANVRHRPAAISQISVRKVAIRVFRNPCRAGTSKWGDPPCCGFYRILCRCSRGIRAHYLARCVIVLPATQRQRRRRCGIGCLGWLLYTLSAARSAPGCVGHCRA